MILRSNNALTGILLVLLNFAATLRWSCAQFVPICPIGFVWGGYCGVGAFSFCPSSLPPFHCIRGSCCRDQRPLIARLGPILYPWDLGIGGGQGQVTGIGTGINGFPGTAGIGGVSGGLCIDSAVNCYSYIGYCFQSQYRLCMMIHCRRTCGFCSSTNGFGGGSGGFGGGIGIG